MTDEQKEQRYEKQKEKPKVKITCDICKLEVTKRSMKQHQQTLHCQSHIPNHEVVPLQKITCERCGKEVSNIYKHMVSLQCQYFPALQLNIPMKVILNRIQNIPEDLNIEELLNKLCEEYKDGYVAPIKVFQKSTPNTCIE